MSQIPQTVQQVARAGLGAALKDACQYAVGIANRAMWDQQVLASRSPRSHHVWGYEETR